jgi:hypothetical protein
MNDERESSLLRFAAARHATEERAAPDASKPTLISDLKEYRAALEWLPGERERGQSGALLIPYADGGEEIIAYSQLMGVQRDKTTEYMCLHFTIGAIEVFGQNLPVLFRQFLPPGNIKELVLFDPLRHQKPKDGEPVIYRTRYQSRADLNQATNREA